MSDSTLVPGAHRRIRVLDPGTAPHGGSLVADADEVRVCVDTAELRGSPVWRFAGADHVVAPLDLVRRPDGLDVLLPWCEERVPVFLGRRMADGEPLSAGETVTLAGSLLRGLAELGTEEGPGAWWLTHAGMPVFAFGDGARPAACAADVLTLVREGTSDRALRRILSEIVQGLDDVRAARRHLDRWEAALLELAAPWPLRRVAQSSGSPEPASARRPVIRTTEGSSGSVDAGDGGGRSGGAVLALRARMAAILRTPATAGGTAAARLHGRAVRSGAVSTGTSSETGRTAGVRGGTASGAGSLRRAPSATGGTADASRHQVPGGGRRRRLLLVGGTAAAVVLLGGVLWPVDDGASPAAADPVSTVPPTKTSASAEPDPVRTAGETPPGAEEGKTSDDPVTAAAALLERIDACRQEGDRSCVHGIAPDAAEGVRAALGDVARTGPLVLVESYGDVAVIRRGSQGGAQQLLVLARRKDEWLVRDVYDVADQPGS